MNHEKYRHPKDKHGTCAESGFSAEQKFKELAEQKGYKVEICGREAQFSHVDFVLIKGKEQIKVDIKGAKKIRRADKKPDFSLTWIEWRNQKDKGWILGSAKIIAFELENEFILVEREKLLDLAKELCHLEILVSKSSDALYKGYRRFGKRDLLSLIETKKIIEIAKEIWEKNT